MNCLSQLRQFIEPSLIEIEKILQVPIFFMNFANQYGKQQRCWKASAHANS